MIHIDNPLEFPETLLLERAARFTLEVAPALHPDLQVNLTDADLTIVLTDDRQLHELNLDYLGVDAPTDVLSFPASETDPETGAVYLGDIVLSIPRAVQQAEAAGHSVEAEAQLLVVHGTLHLLGYDHATDEEKAVMWAEQAKVLEKLGLARIKIQE
ncbi:MAG TPA: rRNA maturation RNase YbeY [Anaerolineales bacterium]|jgi:probable rRNA maturation factor|nr:rRNA maturation RNase YbeY [Anaerolineae bacterium]HRJ55623.1 rRNA maturation RNase YbeY [Anaerolineales bacterium]HRK89403.1 rRNA maturation RNase YbeY [Anaerolineales bacterium]